MIVVAAILEPPERGECAGSRCGSAAYRLADVIYDETEGCASPTTRVDPLDVTRRRTLGEELAYEDLLMP